MAWWKKTTKPTRKKENIFLALPNESQNWGDNHFVPLLQRKKLTFAANRFHNRRYCKVTPLYKIMTSYANDQEADLNYRKTFPRDGFNEEPATKWNARSLTRKIDSRNWEHLILTTSKWQTWTFFLILKYRCLRQLWRSPDDSEEFFANRMSLGDKLPSIHFKLLIDALELYENLLH